MDAKISKDSRLETRLNMKDYLGLCKMVNSIDEDLSVAISNMKNLKYSFLDIRLILKTVAGMQRRRMIKELEEAGFPGVFNDTALKFSNLYTDIKSKGTDQQKKIFEYLLNDSIVKSYSNIDSMSFIKDIKTKIVW
tara:strand:+ start:247 stop:654 length:408 start_codon:yes stop_codon:yes gene_type:complete